MKSIKIKEKGITLIALIVTIIVLLILAGISIRMITDDNGIIIKSREAKIQAEIDEEKDKIQLSQIQAKTKSKKNVFSESGLKIALDSYIGKDLYVLEHIDDDYYVTYKDSERKYKINGINGKVSLVGGDNNDDNDNNIDDGKTEVAKDETPGDYTNNGTLDGTAEKPYEISSVEDLIKFAEEGDNSSHPFKDKYIKLTTDINFTDESSYVDSTNSTMFPDYNGDGVREGIMKEIADGYEPISDLEGTFDGQGHTIEKFFIEKENESYLGFFGNLSNGAVIKNLTLEGDIKYKKSYAESPYNRIGGIAGRNEKDSAGKTGTIENCVSKVNIEVVIDKLVAKLDNSFYIGGVAGNNEGKINNCKNDGNITVTIERGKTIGTETNKKSNFYIGGIAGKSAGAIGNSSNKGKITFTATSTSDCDEAPDDKIGGILGTNEKTELTQTYNCANFGDINVKTNKNAIIGGIGGEIYHNSNETAIKYSVQNVYNKGNIKVEFDNTESHILRIGGIGGHCRGNALKAYNIGKVEQVTTGGSSTKYIGYIIGDREDEYEIKDCEYLKIDANVKGTQGDDEDRMSPRNQIIARDSFTEKEVKDKMNEYVNQHNAESEEKWITW